GPEAPPPAESVRRAGRRRRGGGAVNNNNRTLILVLCVAAGAGLLMLGYNLFLSPLLEYDREIDEKAVAVAKKHAQVQQILRDKARLQEWRTLSLPGVENLPKTKGVSPNP